MIDVFEETYDSSSTWEELQGAIFAKSELEGLLRLWGLVLQDD
jgi:hypothetical protein